MALKIHRFRFDFTPEGVEARSESRSPRGTYFAKQGTAKVRGEPGTQARKAAVASLVEGLLKDDA